MKRVFYIILFLLGTTHVLSLQKLQSFLIKNDDYTRFQNFSSKDGLSSNSVLCIVQDHSGMMWFGTMNGLNRFDGYSFTTYKKQPGNPHSLSNNFITCLAVDKYGDLWVGTQNGLNRFDRNTNTFIRYFNQPTSQSISNNYIKALATDKRGYLWIDTRSGGGDILDIRAKHFTHFPHKNGEFEGDYYYHQIFEDSRNNVWIGGRCFMATKLSKGNPKQVTDVRVTGASYNDINTFVETADKKIVGFSYEKVLAVYNEKSNTFEKIKGLTLPGNPCRAVTDNDGRVWVGGYNGLQLIDLKKMTMTPFFNHPLNDFSIPSNTIYCVYKDDYGNIWLGSNYGISLYSARYNFFRHYRQIFGKKSSMTSNHITALMEDRDELLWVGTEVDGVDTVTIGKDHFGNVKYNILTKNIDEKTFIREKDILKEYFRRKLIKATDPKLTADQIFASYRSYHSAGLSFSDANENQVTVLYQDKRGKIYTGMYSGIGFNCYDKKTRINKRYVLKGDIKPPYIQEPSGGNYYKQFLEDRQSRLWCVTWESLGLNLFDRDKQRFDGKIFFPARHLKTTTSKMLFDPIRKRLWMVQNSSIVYYDLTERKFHRFIPELTTQSSDYDIHRRYYAYLKCAETNFPPDFCVNNFTFDNDGYIWLCSENTLLKVRITDMKMVKQIRFERGTHICSGDIKSIIYDHDHQNIWLTKNNTLYCCNIPSGSIKSFHLQGVNEMLCMKKIGDVWWLGAKNGLWTFDEQKNTFKHLNISYKNISIANVSRIMTDPTKQIWVACDVGFIKIIDGKIVEKYTYTSAEIPGSEITATFRDRQGQFWIGTNNGLTLFQPHSKQFRRFYSNPGNKYALINNNIYSLAEDHLQNIWISTEKGWCKYDYKTNRFIDYSMPDDDCISSRLGSCVLQDKKGNLWYGTTDKGLNKIDNRSEIITHYSYHQWDSLGISSNNINCLYQDSKNRIWAGTNQGINLFVNAKNSFIHYDIDNGLPDNNIMAIVEDKKGNLWLSTQKGLCCFNPDKTSIRKFYRSHGIADDEFTGAACRLHNGDMAFGSFNGFIVFTPDSLNSTWKATPALLYDLRLNDQLKYTALENKQEIDVNYSDNSFSVYFSCSDFASSGTVKYRYKLQGFDKDWISPDNSTHSAKYTNLAWGNYIFTVECSNPFGEWNGATTILYINVLKPWFVSWWFLLSAAFILVLFVVMIIRIRETNLRVTNLRLEKVVKKRTFELSETNRKLMLSEKNLQKEIETKDKFFAIISHDLRNPSRSISQIADLLYSQYEKMNHEQAGEFLKLLSETASTNHKLIEKLLYWAMAQQHDFPINPIEFDIKSLINNVCEQSKPEAGLKNILLNTADVFSANVFADYNMIDTVLRNLISNAIKFSHKDGEVIVSVSETEKETTVSVADFGIGMDQNEIDKLFHIGSKVRKDGTSGEKGTGLGLILCVEFIRKNGGEIFAESIKNKKTIVTFTVPKLKER